jgi:tetratricopeptide (TPR) repeat protein
MTVAAAAILALVVRFASGSGTASRAWVLIADVENRTGDPVFEHTVPVAIAASLAQSSLVYVTSPERVRQALVRMRRSGADTLLDEGLALEIARREGIRAVIVPTVVASGDGYELGARLIDPQTRGVLGARSVRAASRADVLGALDRVGRALRRELGESVLSVATNTVPLPRVTTASLDALKSYADGYKAFGFGRWTVAETLFKQAVSYDSTFASAYAALGMLCFWTNRPTEGNEHFEQALARMSDLPEREQIMIRADAHAWRGNRDASITLLRSYLVGNPDDFDALHRLGYDLLRQNKDAEAAPLLRRILTIDSMSWQVWLNLATVEKGLGQPDSAITHYQRAFALAPWAETGNDNLNLEYGTTYLMLGDTPAAAAVFSKMLDVDRERRARGLRSLAYLALLRGEYRKAVRQLTEAIAVNRSIGPGARVSELRNRLLLASTLEQLGEPGGLREQLDSAFALSRRLDMESTLFFWLGKALARAGDARRAGLLLDSLEPRVKEGNTDRARLEGLRGEVLVARGDATGAIPHLESMLSADSTAYTLESLAFGVAASGDLDRAATLYTHLSNGADFGWEGQQYHRLAPYWLGRIEERRGNRAAAVRAFQTFVEAWQQADPDLVALADARSRLDRLRLSDSPR